MMQHEIILVQTPLQLKKSSKFQIEFKENTYLIVHQTFHEPAAEK